MSFNDAGANAPNSFNVGYGGMGGFASQSAANNAVPRMSLSDDAQAVAAGLSSLHRQIDELSCRLLGPMPSNGADMVSQEQAQSLRSITSTSREQVDLAVQRLSSILANL